MLTDDTPDSIKARAVPKYMVMEEYKEMSRSIVEKKKHFCEYSFSTQNRTFPLSSCLLLIECDILACE